MSDSIFKRLAIHTPHGRPTPANMRYVDDLRTVFDFENGTLKGRVDFNCINPNDGLEKLLWTSFDESNKRNSIEGIPLHQVSFQNEFIINLSII